MLTPSRALLWALAAAVAAAAVLAFFPGHEDRGYLLLGMLCAAAALDAALALRPARLEGTRQVAGTLALGAWVTVGLRIANRGGSAAVLTVHDHPGAASEVRDLPRDIVIAARGWGVLRYGLRPLARGDFNFGRIEVRLRSPLRLWRRRLWLGQAARIRVYPNFAALVKYALLAVDNRLSQIGVLKRRRRGAGLEFHQLRDYRDGDALRQIDWKATARMRRLISRDYQDERDQQVVFLIDSGRRMATQDGELSHFDHALNAVLLLSYVGLRQGDAVGFMTLGGEPRWFAPRKSPSTVNLIMQGLYDLQPTLAMPDYTRAATDLTLRLRKRALVIVMSNLRDEDDEGLLPALEMLGRRHLVVYASLREKLLSRVLEVRADTFDRALTRAAAADYLHARELVFRRIAASATSCLDVEPERMPIALVNRYLDIKRSGWL